MPYQAKIFHWAETKVEDAGSGLIRATVSDESRDRDGDIIRQRFWDLDSFTKHPVLVSSHDYTDLRKQLGTWRDMVVKGTKLIGLAQYMVGEGNDEADWGFKLATKGWAAYSVGFMPDMGKAKALEDGAGGYEFKGQELLEVSQVIIPSNANAVQRMLKEQAESDPAFARVAEMLNGRENEFLKTMEGQVTQAENLQPSPEIIESLWQEMLPRLENYIAEIGTEAPEVSITDFINGREHNG
jgi:hypothetical protein